MPEDTADQARRLLIGEYVEWIKRFDINDYVKNRPMIEKLYEEKQLALASSYQLEIKLKELETRIHEMELQNQKLDIQVHDASKRAVFTFLIALLATVLIGIGVNIATSAPYSWTGWVMIVAACLLQATPSVNRSRRIHDDDLFLRRGRITSHSSGLPARLCLIKFA